MDIADPCVAAAPCPAPPCIDLQPDGAVRAINHTAIRLLRDSGQASGLSLRRADRLPLGQRTADIAARMGVQPNSAAMRPVSTPTTHLRGGRTGLTCLGIAAPIQPPKESSSPDGDRAARPSDHNTNTEQGS